MMTASIKIMPDSLPPRFVERMKGYLGDGFPAFVASYQEKPETGIRVNTHKISISNFKELTPFMLKSIPWINTGFIVDSEKRPGKHPYHAAGLYYVQDPSAMAVGELLSPKPGERVLDLAAAPGGKATHIASAMKGEGLLVANDLHPQRVRHLANNIERWGAANTVVLNETPPKLVEHFGAYFDRVVVDAPCSGEGTFRKDSGERKKWSEDYIAACAVRQDGLLADAGKLVRPGGVLVYSTCTFAPEEDEGTIARFLDDNPDFQVQETPKFDGFEPGKPEWLGTHGRIDDLRNTIRLLPHLTVGEGHFIAVLKKNSEEGNMEWMAEDEDDHLLQDSVEREYRKFANEALEHRVQREKLRLRGNRLYAVPSKTPSLEGLRVVHWGWWLGIQKKDRFEPVHAYAAGMRAEDVLRSVDFSGDNPDAIRYLHGEVLQSPGDNGWVLVTVDGYSLGWAKRVQNRLKSRSPKMFRWI